MANSFFKKILDPFFDRWMGTQSLDAEDGRVGELFANVVSRGLDSAFEDFDLPVETILREVFQIDEEQSSEFAARTISMGLEALIPDYARTLDSIVLSSKYDHAGRTDQRKSPEPPADPDKILENVPEEMRESAETQLAKTQEVAASFPSRWSPGFILAMFDFWEERLELLREVCDSEQERYAIDRMMHQINDERSLIPSRYEHAQEIKKVKGQGLLSSNRFIGNFVHSVLQGRYLLNRPTNSVISESWVYHWVDAQPRRDRLIEYGAKHYQDTGDYSFVAADLSRISPFVDETKKRNLFYLRYDLMDMHSQELFEIKPTGSAPDAVIQECYYRMSYEMQSVNAVCLGYSMRVPRVEPGSPLNTIWLRDPLTLREQIDFNFLRITPFLNPLLPGVVLYFITENEEHPFQKVIEAHRALFRAIERAYEFYRKLVRLDKLIKLVIAVVLAIVFVVVMLFVVVAVVIGIILAIAKFVTSPAVNPAELENQLTPVPAQESAPVSVPASTQSKSLAVSFSHETVILELNREPSTSEKPTQVRIGRILVSGIYAHEIPTLLDNLNVGIKKVYDALGRDEQTGVS